MILFNIVYYSPQFVNKLLSMCPIKSFNINVAFY